MLRLIDADLGRAYAKAQMAASSEIPLSGNMFISVKDSNKDEAVEMARQFSELGFTIYSTSGTASQIKEAGVPVNKLHKLAEGRPNVLDMIKNDQADFIINTTEGRRAIEDSAPIRASAEVRRVFYTTTLTAAEAICMTLKHEGDTTVRRLQDLHRRIGS